MNNPIGSGLSGTSEPTDPDKAGDYPPYQEDLNESMTNTNYFQGELSED
jgi:hypothetical protein